MKRNSTFGLLLLLLLSFSCPIQTKAQQAASEVL